MTISKYQVKVDNNDRNHHNIKFFSNIYDAQRYYDNYKDLPGDKVQLLEIGVEE